MLTAEDILGADDIKIEKVPTPEWAKNPKDPASVAKAFVFVRSVSGAVRDVWEHSSVSVKLRGKKTDVATNFENARAKLLVHAICNEQGQLLFNRNQIEALGRKNSAPLDRCFAVAQRLSGISQEDIEEIVGNSDAAPSEDLS